MLQVISAQTALSSQLCGDKGRLSCEVCEGDVTIPIRLRVLSPLLLEVIKSEAINRLLYLELVLRGEGGVWHHLKAYELKNERVMLNIEGIDHVIKFVFSTV